MRQKRSGQQLRDENVGKFAAWVVEREAANDWVHYTYRDKLKRVEIARECGFAKSVLQQNPEVRSALAGIETDLVTRGILAPPSDSDQVANKQAAAGDARSRQRIKQIEEQNHALRAEVAALKEQLKRYDLLDEYLLDSGRLPR